MPQGGQSGVPLKKERNKMDNKHEFLNEILFQIRSNSVLFLNFYVGRSKMIATALKPYDTYFGKRII